MNPALTVNDFAAISPLLILLGGALLLLLLESFAEEASKKYAFMLTLATLVLAICATGAAPPSVNSFLTPWLRFDALARFFTLFFLLIGLSVALLSASFFQRFEATHGEYFFLLLSSLFGLVLIGAAADLLTLFFGDRDPIDLLVCALQLYEKMGDLA